MAKKKHDENENENEETLVIPAVELPDEGASDATPLEAPAAEPPLGDVSIHAETASEDEGDLDQPPLAAIVELSGPGDGRVTIIAGGHGEIGRTTPTATLRLPYDGWTSSTHARLTYQQGAWTLEDLNSTNGTWLDNGRTRIRQPVVIALGQIFRVGHTDLMLTDDPDVILTQGEPV